MTIGKKIALGFVIGIPLCCCGGGWMLMQALFGKAASERDFELAEARKAGIPTEPADLEAMIKVPDSQNAAPFYVDEAGRIH